MDNEVALADTYVILGETFVKLKRWEKALDAFARAEKSSQAMQNKQWQLNLQKWRLDAYIGFDKTVDALRISQLIIKLQDEKLREEKALELNKVRVSMGLEIEEQRNTMLAKQLHDAEVLRRFFFGVLALAGLAILLLALFLRQTQRARKSQERMQRILEHIEEGILSIGHGMQVEADLSPYLSRLLAVDPSLAPETDMFSRLLESSELKSDEKAGIRSILQACLGEQELMWDLNAAQIPLEISIQQGKKQLSLDWQPLYGDDGSIRSILITVRDITTRKNLQKQIDLVQTQASNMQQRMLDILKVDAISMDAFVRESQAMIIHLRSDFATGTDLTSSFRQLHTLKGMSRTLGFKELSTLVHDLEDEWDAEQSNLKNPEQAQALFLRLDHSLQEYAGLIARMTQRDARTDQPQDIGLVELVSGMLSPIRRTLQKVGLFMTRIEIRDQVKVWPQSWLDAARLALLHGLTNSADHGFVLPLQRGELITQEPMFEIKAQESSEGLQLEICDNGVGLNFTRLQKLADKVGFRAQSDETLGDLVFMDGVSTAESVSSSSGRGIGMASVKQAAQAQSGIVRFRANQTGKGSSLLVRIPRPPQSPISVAG